MNSLLAEPQPITAFQENSTPSNMDPFPRLVGEETSARILYVEDEPSLRSFGELVLARSGFTVDTAADGEEAWEALKTREYQLLITDNHMPNLTGLELIRNVCAAGLCLPIILASSIVGTCPNSELPQFQCGALLDKPFTPSQLVSAVREVLQESSLA